HGNDLALSPDGKYLLVCGYEFIEPVAVVDIAARAQIGTFSPGNLGHNSIDIGSDGSVLVTSLSTNAVLRYLIDGAGTLTYTGEVQHADGPVNVYVAPGNHAAVVAGSRGKELESFAVPGLALVDPRDLGTSFANCVCGVFNSTGTLFYARLIQTSSRGQLAARPFNPATGAFGPAPVLAISSPTSTMFRPGGQLIYGIEHMALHPDDSRLFISESGAVRVRDAATGALIASITAP